MSRYVYVHISWYFCNLYDQISINMQGLKLPKFLPVCAIFSQQTDAHAHTKRPVGANNAACVFDAVDICAYLFVFVHIFAYLCISDSTQIWVTE